MAGREGELVSVGSSVVATGKICVSAVMLLMMMIVYG